MKRTITLGLASLLAACDSTAPAPVVTAPPGIVRDRTVTGSATPVMPGNHPPMTTPLRLDDPSRAAHVGRAPRRLDIDQFRASLEGLLGASWTAPRQLPAPEVPGGTRFEPNTDMIEFFAATLGRPDFVATTSEVLEPTVTFSKLSGDAARSVCARGVVLDAARPATERRLLLTVSETDTVPANETAVRANIAALAMRLWGLQLAPTSETVEGVLEVFRVAVAQPRATPLDGWRAVCIAFATDTRFLTY